MDRIKVGKIPIPEGYTQTPLGIIEGIYFNDKEIVIVGFPDETQTPPNHHCDSMGCSSISHVIYRGPLLEDAPEGG